MRSVDRVGLGFIDLAPLGSTSPDVAADPSRGALLDAGDALEFENATNYPLVRITNEATHHVFYARTHDHSTMGVATGDAIVSSHFDVPAAMEKRRNVSIGGICVIGG